jgi:replicative DNA helicase
MNYKAVVNRLLFCERNHISNSTNEQSGHLKGSTTERIYEVPLYIEDTPNIPLPDLIAKAKQMRSEKQVEIIIIDYLTLITSVKKSRNKQIREVSSSLKGLAQELSMPIVVLVQVKRNDKGLPPTLVDIRGGNSIVKDADTIIFLHEQLREDNETEIIVAKHRAYI